MDYKNILLFITTGANIGLAFYILQKNLKNRIHILFSIMLFLIAIWSFEIAMFRASIDPYILIVWFHSFYVTAALIALIFYYFCFFFPYPLKKLNLLTIILNIITTLIIIYVIYGAGILHTLTYDATGDHLVSFNVFNYFLYVVYFCGYIIASFLLLAKKIGASTSHNRKVIMIVFFATLLSALAGSIFDLFLPFFTYQYIWLGPLFTMIMVFIIVRYLFIKTPE